MTLKAIKTASGIHYMNQGLAYEQLILKLLTKPRSSLRKDLIKQIEFKYKQIVKHISFEPSGLHYEINYLNKKVNIKPDILCTINHKITFGISVKNTRQSFQLFNTTYKSFLDFLKHHNILCDNNFKNGFGKYLGGESFSPNELLRTKRITKNQLLKLKQKDRGRFTFHELSKNEQKSIKKIFSNRNFKQKFLIHVWKTNSIKNKQFHAEFLIVNNESYSKTNIVDPFIINTNKLITEEIKKDLKISDEGIISFGGISLNLKGSGRNKKDYHSLQVKKTLNNKLKIS